MGGVEVMAVSQSPWTADCRGAESQWLFGSRPGGSVAEEKGDGSSSQSEGLNSHNGLPQRT